jgi:hypothetical protein
LEFELAEHRKLLDRADSTNKYLLQEVNTLRKERGMKVVEVNLLSEEIGALRGTGEEGVAKEDLKRTLLIVDKGVKEGVIKVGVVWVWFP